MKLSLQNVQSLIRESAALRRVAWCMFEAPHIANHKRGGRLPSSSSSPLTPGIKEDNDGPPPPLAEDGGGERGEQRCGSLRAGERNQDRDDDGQTGTE